MHCNRDHQLGLTTTLETIVEGLARVLDLFHHLTQLIHFDRKNTTVAARISLVFDRFAKELIELNDSRVEEVLNTHGEK